MPETVALPWDNAKDERILDSAEEVEEEITAEAQEEQMQAVEQTISDLNERSGLTE